MRKTLLVFLATWACSTTVRAYDIAFYVGAPNVDGWYSVDAQTKDVETIIAKTGHLFKEVRKFDDAHLNDFAAWIDANTNDGEIDIIWLNGCTPSVLYQFPNVNPDGSRAEKWLDGGDMIINVGDWFAYCSYEGGTRQSDNGGTGAANILDLSSSIIAGSGQGVMAATPTGKKYLPSLNDVSSDRPILLSAVAAPWEVAAVFAQNTDGTYADPVVLRNTATGGYIAFINQASTGNWIADRGLTCAEFISNWVTDAIGLGAQPLAMQPNPKDGSMIETSVAPASWRAGDFAVLHDVYFGASYDEVSAADRDSAGLYLGRQATTQLVMGTAGGVAPDGLVPGKTYYWRVDEVNDAEPGSPWKGNVWSFTVRPLTAFEPFPVDGVKYVGLDQDLSWKPGQGVVFHSIFLGKSAAEVANATAASMMTVDLKFSPGPLEPDTTYYWRVDEFTGTATNKGPVWSFTTVPTVAVGDPHLLGWWTLDEGMGNTAVDWSGHGNHGALMGGPAWVDGFFGGALEFGPGKYINCGTEAAKGVTGDFTLAAWVKLNPGNAGVYGGIGGRLVIAASNYYGFALVRHSADVFRLWVGDGTTDLAKSAVSSDLTYTDTEWHHVAGVHQGQANRLFMDGVQQTGTTNIAFVPSTDFFHIGRQYSHSDDRYFPGVIDDVRVYDTASDAAAIKLILEGNPNVAGAPAPDDGVVVDIRSVSDLAWSAGKTAASHDVYFGTDRAAVAEADHSSAAFRGNQTGTGFALSGLVAFGGGDYYWRIDEVEAGGTVHKGYVWKFTVPDCLIVDDFESYTDAEGNRIYEAWLDGIANSNSTSVVGYAQAPFAEQRIVHGGRQSLPFDYNNVKTPYFAEAEYTWTKAQDWTVEGVNTLSLFVRGTKTNGAGTLYVGLQDSTGKLVAVANANAALLTSDKWTEWKVPLADFGVKATAIKKIVIGVGDRNAPKPGGAGRIYIDDVRLVRP